MKYLVAGVLAALVAGVAFSQAGSRDATYHTAMDLLADGRQKDAEAMVGEACATYPEDQELLFLRGVMERSRFHRADAFKTFANVYSIDAETMQGQAAMASSTMDFEMGVDEGLGLLRKLIEEHPNEILLRWLFAIQCRTCRKYPEEAEEQYLIILGEWNPGPVMVNHTYANILTESLGRPEEALLFRERALSLAQRGWTYQGYANTLRELGRYEEAGAAFEKAVEIAPERVTYWRQWGDCLMDSGHVKEAYGVFRKAYEAGLTDPRILTGLGRANELGRGTPKNDIQALGWYKLAAKEDSGEAMYRLGRMREDGRGEPKDYAAAAEWHRKSLETGYDRSLQDLVRLHAAGGYGLDRDLRKAESWHGALPASSSPEASGVQTTLFSGLAFMRENVPGRSSWVLDYDGTCRALQARIPRGDEGARDLLAWMHAVTANPDPKLRGAAVNLAEKLCRKDENNPQWRNTLAAAYAREGRFVEAVGQQRKAIGLLSPARKESKEGEAYATRLELYKSGRPYTAYCGEAGVQVEPVAIRIPASTPNSAGTWFGKEGNIHAFQPSEKKPGGQGLSDRLELYRKGKPFPADKD